MEGRKGLPMPPWGQSCRDVVSNGTGAPPAGAPEHTGMLGRTRVGGSNAQTRPFHLAHRIPTFRHAPSQYGKTIPRAHLPLQPPQTLRAPFPSLPKQAQRGVGSLEHCPWLIDEPPPDQYGSEFHPGSGGSCSTAQERGRRRAHFYPPSVLRRVPDAPAIKLPGRNSHPGHRTVPRKHDRLGTPGLHAGASPAMSVALGGPQMLGDPPRVCSFNWVTQESGGWL